METFGQFLKEKRIKSDKSLEEISQVTRIRKGLLEALEQDKYDLLPPRSYVRGMVKLYAQEVGIDINEVLDRFETAPIDKPKTEGSARLATRAPSTLTRGYLLLLIIIGIVFIIYFTYIKTGVLKQSASRVTPPQETSDKPLPRTSIPVTSIPAQNTVPGFIASAVPEAVTPTAATSEEKPSLDTRPFTMRFEAQTLTWMRIQTDGKKSSKIILKQGESYRVTADNTIKVRLGNAGGVSIYFNELPLQASGKSGEVINLEFPEAAKRLFKTQ